MKFLGPLLALFCWLVVGCDRVDKTLSAQDETNPSFRQALASLRERDYAGAAQAYEAALQAYPNLPRAHFELAQIYGDRLNDAIRSMYHYQEYLKLAPAGDNRDAVQARFDATKIGFAAQVPNSPIQNAEAFAKLQGDNQNLARQLQEAVQKINDLSGKLKLAQKELSNLPAGTNGETTTPDNPLVVPDPPNPGGAVGTGPNTTIVTDESAVPPPTPAPVAPPVPPPPAATPAHSYTIVQGDSLWKIAAKFYPGQVKAGVEKIKQANTEVLGEGKPLKIGAVLNIP